MVFYIWGIKINKGYALAIYHRDKREEQVNELNKNFCLKALIYQKKRKKKKKKKPIIKSVK